MSINILVVGNGGREHALCWRLAQSGKLGRLVCAPGNAGTTAVAENVSVSQIDVGGVVDLAIAMSADLVVIGPEAPLALGLADRLRDHHIPTFGPSQAAVRIESSKQWAKQLMVDVGVPTAQYVAVDDLWNGMVALQQFTYPVVIKADGLAAGKGVVIVRSYEEAVTALTALLEERSLGDAASTVLIEKCLSGPEVSIFALTDGTAIRIISPACDYKRAFDNDLGPNTGGMGAFAPTAMIDQAMTEQIERTILRPTIDAMRKQGCPMNGMLYAGLMMTSDGPTVIEFNARFGDPETQVVLPLLDGDFVELCYAVAAGSLDQIDVRLRTDRCAVGVVIASGGYPGPYGNGKAISGLGDVDPNALVFPGGTAVNQAGEVASAGGRVLTVVGTGVSLTEARLHAYAAAERIGFEGSFYRSDIGLRDRTL